MKAIALDLLYCKCGALMSCTIHKPMIAGGFRHILY